jgi:hypothetical protein
MIVLREKQRLRKRVAELEEENARLRRSLRVAYHSLGVIRKTDEFMRALPQRLGEGPTEPEVLQPEVPESLP